MPLDTPGLAGGSSQGHWAHGAVPQWRRLVGDAPHGRLPLPAGGASVRGSGVLNWMVMGRETNGERDFGRATKGDRRQVKI